MNNLANYVQELQKFRVALENDQVNLDQAMVELSRLHQLASEVFLKQGTQTIATQEKRTREQWLYTIVMEHAMINSLLAVKAGIKSELSPELVAQNIQKMLSSLFDKQK